MPYLAGGVRYNYAMNDAPAFDKAFIASFATSVPQYRADQSFAGEFMRKHFGGVLSHRSRALLRTMFAPPGVRKRQFYLR